MLAESIHTLRIPRHLGRFVLAFYFLAILVVFPSSSHAERTTQVYPVQHRMADNLIEIARGLMSGDGQVLLDTAHNALILIGPEARVKETIAVLEIQDQPTPIVGIRYRVLKLESLSRHGLSIAWSDEPGVGVGRVRASDHDALAGRLYRTTEDSEFVGVVQIHSGEEGRIGQGRSVPLPVRDRFDRVVSGAATGERGLIATPTVMGDGRIQLVIASSVSDVDDGGTVEFTKGRTTLAVTPGETIALGSLSSGGVERGRGGKSYSTRVGRSDQIFLLTLEIVIP